MLQDGFVTVVIGEIHQGHDGLQLFVLVMEVTCSLPRCLKREYSGRIERTGAQQKMA
jgi:hypothetical protein